jgi:GrpB-like predicted nucleotidyltransferase (UPF0157 family)
MSDEIEIVDYDPSWPGSFAVETCEIQRVLADLHPSIEHIGSTAIPGLCAKPIIDILVGLDDIRDGRIIPGLELVGYKFQPEAGESDRLFFRKGAVRSHHVHVVDIHSWAFWKHVMFRDYLLFHPSITSQYGDLKRASAEKYRFDRPAYTGSKSGFIESVLRAATLKAFITVTGQYTLGNRFPVV